MALGIFALVIVPLAGGQPTRSQQDYGDNLEKVCNLTMENRLMMISGYDINMVFMIMPRNDKLSWNWKGKPPILSIWDGWICHLMENLVKKTLVRCQRFGHQPPFGLPRLAAPAAGTGAKAPWFESGMRFLTCDLSDGPVL